jgi:hypothetical protein
MLPGDAKPGRAVTGGNRRAGDPCQAHFDLDAPSLRDRLGPFDVLLSLPLWQRPRSWMAPVRVPGWLWM